jgi:oligoribonuclease NrnB/cAMP/cGMP phosphodiesterase (DHH superfamily)
MKFPAFKKNKDDPERKLYLLQQELQKYKELLQEKEKLIQERDLEISKLEAEMEKLMNKLREESAFPLLERYPTKTLIKSMLEIIRNSRRFYRKLIRSAEEDTIIFVHDDGDGVCCGALCEKYFSETSKRIFHIGQEERYLIPEAKPRQILFAADLVLDNKLTEHILSLAEKGIDVKWVDHHKESLNIRNELLDRLKNNGILIWEDASSAASLVREYLRMDDEISRRISLIADRCDGKKEQTKEVETDARTITKLVELGEPTISRLRRELARYGEVRSERLKEKTVVTDLLEIYGESLLKEKLLYEDKNFLLYRLTRKDPYLVGIKGVISRIARESGKDVYVILEKKDVTIVKGETKLGAGNVFPTIAEKFGGSSYFRAHVGNCNFNEKLNEKELINLLKDLYKREEIKKSAYSIINAPIFENPII